MTAPNADALKALLPLLRQLRDIKGVRESMPGRFVCRQITLVQFVENAGVVGAELKKAGGSGVDRYALDTPAQQRKLVDDAKRRASALDDE